jgi:uncharacterized protein
MSRLLFFVAVIVVVYLLLRNYRRQAPGEEVREEDMVRCEHCGVHLPKRESILADNKYFCNEEHRRLYADGSE